MINLLLKTGTDWMATAQSSDKFLVGDISWYTGGKMNPHSTHKDGNGVDLSGGPCCNIKSGAFNKEKSLELANILVKNGATRILFSCKYVQDKCSKVFALFPHHHHFHVDLKKTSAGKHPEVEGKRCKKSVYDKCDYASKVKRSAAELTP